MTDSVKANEFVEQLSQGRGRLFGFIHALVMNLDDTEDLFQQVAALLWTKYDSYQPGTDFVAWGLRIADFTVKNFVRQRRRARVLFDDDTVGRILEQQTALDGGASQSRLDAFVGCMKKLSRGDRRLIELCYGGDRSIRDVAGSEGRSVGAMYVTLHRIRRMLFECIERRIRAEVRQ